MVVSNRLRISRKSVCDIVIPQTTLLRRNFFSLERFPSSSPPFACLFLVLFLSSASSFLCAFRAFDILSRVHPTRSTHFTITVRIEQRTYIQQALCVYFCSSGSYDHFHPKEAHTVRFSSAAQVPVRENIKVTILSS